MGGAGSARSSGRSRELAAAKRFHYSRQRAYRLRRRQIEPTDADRPSTRLRREQRLIDQTVYECSSCQERLLGERRCDACNLWCRKLGLGGRCSGCDDVLTLSELLGFDLNSKEVTLT